MTTEEITALLTRHVGILNNPDQGSRTPAIAEAYAESLRFVDPHLEFTGREHLGDFIQNLHQQFPGAVFRPARPADAHHGIARLSWEFGPPAHPSDLWSNTADKQQGVFLTNIKVVRVSGAGPLSR